MKSGDFFAHLTESFVKSAPTTKDISNVEQKSINDKPATTNNIVGAMCHNEKASNIFFQDARFGWQGSAMKSAGSQMSKKCYRFTINDERKRPSWIFLQWEKKDEEVESVTLPKEEMFILFLIDRKAKRKSKIATMTKNEFKIHVRKSSVLESLQDCFDLMEYTDSEFEVRNQTHIFEARLYTLTLTLGMWVGFQEAWFK